ncbi:MAG TPA: permease-like cell division protein FtsX [Streptosporangiaceae bacterium]|nr:permease-like cell division protein FtsX [Streptosporangiaceae bacterium]
MRSQFVLSEIWIGLRRNLTMTLALIGVVSISLALLGTGLLFVKQVDKARSLWQGKAEMSIYFCIPAVPSPVCNQTGNATAEERQQLQQRLSGMSQVESVVYVSQQQAWQQFRTYDSVVSGMQQFLSAADMPDSLEVKLKDPAADYGVVASAVSGAPGVANVENEMAVLGGFFTLLNAVRDAVASIAVIALLIAALLVTNTIRLSAYNRRRETAIMRLVGASNTYIRLPFVLEAAIAGLIGWLISVGLLISAKSFLLNAMDHSLKVNVGLTAGDLVEVVFLVLLAGLLLCGLTSTLTLRRYLRI